MSSQKTIIPGENRELKLTLNGDNSALTAMWKLKCESSKKKKQKHLGAYK